MQKPLIITPLKESQHGIAPGEILNLDSYLAGGSSIMQI